VAASCFIAAVRNSPNVQETCCWGAGGCGLGLLSMVTGNVAYLEAGLVLPAEVRGDE
jgi:hypothetical protein